MRSEMEVTQPGPFSELSNWSLRVAAMLVVCTLKFEMDPRYNWIEVRFEDLRYCPPFVEVRLDKSGGVFES